MNATRRSIRIHMIDTCYWEITAVDTEFLPDGRQKRQLAAVRYARTADVRRVAQEILEQHISSEIERQYQASVEAGERD
jgi:maltoporin